MTHAVPRPRTPSTRAAASRPRHPASSGRPVGVTDRALGTHAVPEARAATPPTLPRRTPGVALDAVHRESVIPLRQLEASERSQSERWFTPKTSTPESGDTIS
jgi:hypothetical protein